MIPLSVEAKLITIVVLALLNLLLLKKKRSDSDEVQSFLVDGTKAYNVADGNDRCDSSASGAGKDGQKIEVLKKDRQEDKIKQKESDNKDIENKFFVRWTKTKQVQNSLKQQPENQIFFEINPINSKPSVEINPIQQQVEVPQLPKHNQNQDSNIFTQPTSNAPLSKPQVTIPIIPIPMQEQRNSQEFQKILQETKSDRQSNSDKPNPKFTNPLFSQRNQYLQKKFPFEPESESDSNSRKTLINLRPKQKSQCKNHCQCCKNQQAPRQTLKRCIQDLIYSTFEEMIEKNNVEQSFGNKKKKRSL